MYVRIRIINDTPVPASGVTSGGTNVDVPPHTARDYDEWYQIAPPCISLLLDGGGGCTCPCGPMAAVFRLNVPGQCMCGQ